MLKTCTCTYACLQVFHFEWLFCFTIQYQLATFMYTLSNEVKQGTQLR